jgi:hypothetical protein
VERLSGLIKKTVALKNIRTQINGNFDDISSVYE